MKAYGQDLRDKVIKVYTEEKLSMSKISERFLVYYETVRDWVNQYKTTGVEYNPSKLPLLIVESSY